MANAGYMSGFRHSTEAANDNGATVPFGIQLAPMSQIVARRNGPDDLVLLVVEGIVEIMIGGAAGFVTAGGFVRVPAEATYAYRNAGDETARLVSRTVASDPAADPAA